MEGTNLAPDVDISDLGTWLVMISAIIVWLKWNER